MKIILGERAEIDSQDLITGRTLLCCISRYGKSYCSRKICEQMFGQAGIGIIDIEGEYTTLLELFPFLIIGRDVPVEPEAAAFLADEILKNKLSFIIDGSSPDLDVAVFQEFIARFVNRFIAMETQAKTPYLFVLEEATELIPEKGVGTSLCLEELTRLVAKGGKRGLGTLIITQRPAFVSKRVISQLVNKLVGRIEWPDDIAVLRKFAQIPDSADIQNLKQGYFYAAGPFIDKPKVIHISPVKTTHLGATPSIIPPTPSQLTDVVSQLAAKLPAVIEAMKPVIPKASEIEARLKEKFEEQWKVRLQRAEKQRDAIRVKTEAKYETEIADLKRKLDDATRHAAMAGPVTEILEHPLVKKNLEKLGPKQRSVVELLETKGPQDAEHLSLFLSISPKSIPNFIHEVNRKIPKLLENMGDGRYASRLVKLFPVTEEAQAEQREVEKLRKENAWLQENRQTLDKQIRNYIEQMHKLEAGTTEKYAQLRKERDELQKRVANMSRELDEYTKLKAELEEESLQKPKEVHFPSRPHAIPTETPPAQQPYVGVEATLRRKLTDFQVQVSMEKLDVDESSWTGKILARGLKGFFEEEKGFGAVMNELERVYSASRTSGGTRDAVQKALEELCAKGIMEREQKAGQWMYSASPEFKERVRK